MTVPDSLRDDLRHFHSRYSEQETFGEETFEIDPSILIPVELNDQELSWEAIISGMLRLISIHYKNPPQPEDELTDIKNGNILSESGLRNIPSGWIDYYRRFVLTVKPEIFNEFLNASIVKTGNGEFDLAMEISDVLEGLFPGSPGVLLNKALILEERAEALARNGHDAVKETMEAMEAFRIALSREPVLPDTLFNAGFFFMRQRDYVLAKECFSRYVSLEEESEIPSEIPKEKINQAKKIIREITKEGLDDRSFQEAYDCINTGKDEEGLAIIRGFLENHPKVWNGWFVLGWALRKLGRYGDGLEALKKAKELGGNSCDILNEKAICLMETGDLCSAQKELELALRKEPENIKLISNLGVLAMRSGKKEEAAAFFRTVLELDPDDALAKHFLEKI